MKANSTRDTYKEVKTFYREGAVVRVHIPDLTEEERKRRMQIISDAAARLLLSEKKIAEINQKKFRFNKNGTKIKRSSNNGLQ